MAARPMFYVLDDENRPVPEHDFSAWGTWRRNARRHLGDDTIAGVRVSTVFLAFDHQFGNGPPLLYETMVFGAPDGDERQCRYATREEALAGHAEALAEVRELVGDHNRDGCRE